MGAQPTGGASLSISVSPKLNWALRSGWEAWETAARAEGLEKVFAWLRERPGNLASSEDVREAVRNLLEAADDEDRALARAELAELAEGADDLLADTLWEGVLAYGREVADADVIFDATSRLAGIAEAHGDPLAAAEYYIDFLNWRRQPEHESDAESVETAFDEVVRLAQADGEQRAAALFTYRQAGYTRLVEADDERATTGDWERDPAPYQSWA